MDPFHSLDNLKKHCFNCFLYEFSSLQCPERSCDRVVLCHLDKRVPVPTTPACTWWNRPEEDNSSGKLESTHPSRTSVKSDQGFFGVESVMRVNADSLLIRAAATSTSGTLIDLTTDLIMANNNNNKRVPSSFMVGGRLLSTLLSFILSIAVLTNKM